MGMVAPPQGIASAYVVFFGVYGDVTRQSLKRNVSRQTLYREAAQTSALLQGAAQRAHVERLQEQVQQLQQRVVSLESDLSQAVVIGDECMARLAAEAQACEQLKSWWNVCTQSTKMGCSEKMHFALEVGHGVNHSFSFVGRTGIGGPSLGSTDS